ncbi:MAG: phosphoserine phosphatase SerB [Candidatus Nitrohelix vancouverensis]|uniref:Phosphoserine phosphatase n=1 Tax=Candidatus Nitrohelix vancouverensis TaxID=2705534 RepID=A0A7T0G465_9BACT|nr:MAG: phosphoserine phosphatase SerB [Candidatus Nitrohelix vancouverensis]
MPQSPKAVQLHVHVSGKDRPGILAEAMESIRRFGLEVLDIKQFVFNGLLNLSLLLDGNPTISLTAFKKELQGYAKKSGMQVNIYPWDASFRPDATYKYRSVVTLLGQAISFMALQELMKTFAALDINVLRIEQLDYGDRHVMEFVIGTRKSHSTVEVLNPLVEFKKDYNVDIAVQEDTVFRRNKRLIVLDADMTFVQCEVIDELGKMAGVGEQLSAITHRAMNGEIEFEEALRERVSLLKGLEVERLVEFANCIPMTPGAEGLVRILKYLGYKVAIVSGGFQLFIDSLKNKYGLDYGFANCLEVVDGKLTGGLVGEIIGPSAKERILESLAKREKMTLKQVVAVGDGANDIPMLAKAGLGIAFNAKPIVQQAAHASINMRDLGLILYFLGISGDELKELDRLSSA